MKRKSFAKINLFLKVVGYDSSYHKLETALAFLDLYDEISVKISDKFSLKIDGEFSKNIDEKNNIITKIHDYFIENFNISKNLEINLTKNIPVGAGLGGGSSNGAEFMKILNQIFEINLSKEKLQEISFNFGSDIAFFFEDQASLIRGRGEPEFNLKEFEDLEILLINPKIALLTKEVFENYAKISKGYSKEISSDEISKMSVFEMIDLGNDLTEAAVLMRKEVGEILDELENKGAKKFKMSGSGATCFGVFEKNKIDKTKKELEEKFGNYFIVKTKILHNL